jgi:2-(1,2-epoxy-1,2-dihydrophenyl)acetyl-CoA isomerase
VSVDTYPVNERLPAEAQQLGAKLASMPTRALGLTKRALNKAWTATVDDTLEYEAFLQHTAGNTADHREGVSAFLEKREAVFRGQ